jgi:hypothetical protein
MDAWIAFPQRVLDASYPVVRRFVVDHVDAAASCAATCGAMPECAFDLVYKSRGGVCLLRNTSDTSPLGAACDYHDRATAFLPDSLDVDETCWPPPPPAPFEPPLEIDETALLSRDGGGDELTFALALWGIIISILMILAVLVYVCKHVICMKKPLRLSRAV